VEGGGGGDDGSDNGATAAVAMWDVCNKGNGGEGAALLMDNDDKANKPSPRAGMDANGGGHQPYDDRLALAWRESASSNTNAHGGRTTIKQRDEQGRGGRGFPHTTIPQKAAVRAAAIMAAIAAGIAAVIAAVIAAARAVEMAVAANKDVGDQQPGRRQGQQRTTMWSTAEGNNVGDNVGHGRCGRGKALQLCCHIHRHL
jgi:hypothetical protein